MRLIRRDGDSGLLELDGIQREVSLVLLQEAELGDYLLVHAGYAIGRVDEEEARITIQLLKEVADHDEARHDF
jgi:hydrogenase expression/formation protein HypC